MIEYLTSSNFIILMIKIIVIFGGVMGSLAYLTWVGRKVMARLAIPNAAPRSPFLKAWFSSPRSPRNSVSGRSSIAVKNLLAAS